MLPPGFKSRLLQTAKEHLQQKINALRTELTDLTQGIENESKSSAGDKHETARAMVQLEQDKIRKQLHELEHQSGKLHQINPDEITPDIRPGSVIDTGKELFFLSIPAGRLTLEEVDVILLSPDSPLGRLLLHKRPGDSFTLNGKTWQVKEIF
jgi:hypothetical protein